MYTYYLQLFLGGMIYCLFSCNTHTEHRSVSLTYFHADSIAVLTTGGHTYYQDSLFSGRLVSYYPNSIDTLSIQSYLHGKEHGEWKQYYPNHVLKEIRYFEHGKKQGEYSAWWQNGHQRLLYPFIDDEYEGTCLEWNTNGVLIKEMNYTKGHEEGSQKVWYDNGNIKSNYVVIDGRRYGLLGTKNCVNASDSIW